MIHYVTSKWLAAPMFRFLAGRGRSLAERIRIVYYDTLLARQMLYPPVSPYIFAALGRDLGSFDPPSPARRAMADFYDFLAKVNGAQKVLNHPQHHLRRYDLLRALYARGINRFNVWRVTDPQGPERYPVLVRQEHGTLWTPIPLANNRAELDAVVAADNSPDGLVAVEYCDTRDAAGIYRKYGAFVVGDRILPRHLFFHRQWQVKEVKLAEAAQVDEEMHYLETNPHADVLREVCCIARISYGRIDYALLDGKPQIWEINVTPTIVSDPKKDIAVREPANHRFTQLFSDALEALERWDQQDPVGPTARACSKCSRSGNMFPPVPRAELPARIRKRHDLRRTRRRCGGARDMIFVSFPCL